MTLFRDDGKMALLIGVRFVSISRKIFRFPRNFLLFSHEEWMDLLKRNYSMWMECLIDWNSAHIHLLISQTCPWFSVSFSSNYCSSIKIFSLKLNEWSEKKFFLIVRNQYLAKSIFSRFPKLQIPSHTAQRNSQQIESIFIL